MNKKIIPIIGILLLLGGFFVLKLNFKKSAIESSFSKGVLALNTDRQEYLPDETVKVQIAALDANGHTVCNANLVLEINNVKEENIQKSATCEDGNVTNNPDYVFNLKPGKIGKYNLKLTNLDTGQVTQNKFTITKSRTLDIVRETAIRINPLKVERYPVKLILKAEKDYQGEISDVIPEGFTIPWQGPAKLDGNKITWQVSLKAGETKVLVYEYTAPKEYLSFYQMGEKGEWQIVVTK